MDLIKKLFVFAAFTALVSCEDKPVNPWNPNWNDPGRDTTQTEKPDTTDKPVPPAGQEKNAKSRFVWIDAAANFKDYANDKDRIAQDMARIKETGFTGVVVDVRPTNSGVLFNSSTEPALKRVDAWVTGGYKWLERTASFDYLQAFIDAGDETGLDVFASVNTMIGGCLCPYGLGEDGILYNDPGKKSWATVINTADGLVNSLDLDDSGAKFLNPANDEVVDYLLSLLADLAAYDLDGIILDRCRYDDYELQSDFSDVSRRKFEEYIGEEVKNWPSDIFAPGAEDIDNPATTMQRKWMEFRAKNIHDFIEKASAKVHSVNPDIRFGAYVGAWYSSYYCSGVNWASPNYNARNSYTWASEDYNSFGYADHCDIMFIGAYASTKSIYGNSEWTMEGFCKRAQALFADDVPFIGGPDIGNSSGFPDGGQGHLMPDIVDACINASTEGMFFFDLCHIKMFDYWDDIKKAFDEYLETL